MRSVVSRTIASAMAFMLACSLPFVANAQSSNSEQSIRVGYVPNWNVQSNTVAALRMTDALDRLGLKVVFTPFLAGGPLNQALLGGQLDVGLIGGGPAVSLIANGGSAMVVARISDVRDALIVKSDSPYKTVADLKGKTIGSFVGTNTYMVLLSLLEKAGLDPKKDVSIVNLNPTAHYGTLMTGDLAAFDTWDPYIELSIERGGVRILAQGKTAGPGVMVVSNDFLKNNRQAALKMVQAIAVGTWYMSKHKDIVNEWLAKDTKMPRMVIERSSEVDRNYRAAPDLANVDLAITAEDVRGLNEVVEYFGGLKMIKTRPDMAKYIDYQLVDEAMADLRKKPVPDLKVVNP